MHCWTTTGVLVTALSDKYADQVKIKDIFDISEIKDICGHKKTHAINFQSIVVPNGLIANLYELIDGKRHCNNANGKPFCVYGDAAYPLHECLQNFSGCQT